MPTTTRKQLWLMMLPLLTLGGCGSDDDDDNDSGTAPATGEAMTLNILHINDHHSHLEPDDQTLTIAGQATEFASGGFARVAAKINERAQALDNVLIIACW